MARMPFAPIDNPRLQHLASAKNRQNGMIAQKSTFGGKSSLTPTKTTLSPTTTTGKRPYEAMPIYEDFDSENVDPAVSTSPSKKSKSVDAFNFSLTPSASKTMPPPPARFSSITPVRANMSTPRTPMTAPAGRSPKRKIVGAGNKNRRVSAPFTRVDPPFSTRASTLPFSLDAALSGTFSTPAAQSAGATIQESMPKNWFFDIHEDTPEEEAGNLMEHSTLTLDLSSDDEGVGRKSEERGKENVAPEGYDGPTASRAAGAAVAAGAVDAVSRRAEKKEVVRVKIVKEEMDDGERSPLSDLETEPFFPEGVDRDAHVIVDGPEEKRAGLVDLKAYLPAVVRTEKDISKVVRETIARPTLQEEVVINTNQGTDIVVWEDDATTAAATTTLEAIVVQPSKDKPNFELHDENTAQCTD
ncbi:hypothetical protein LTR62_008547 [Meristemomyces frigidus]|uniref:Uncharacterized protein n=1 Tax=Meristemomyces frigidus TaxID=1508187 RepID=A0AAN7TGU1_9PEZI|nr:hypothetical protein LTR62_008547 [Meristemomyces frigidus]